MILTKCAVCATDRGLTLGKKCGRCSTRYCGAECQVQHWKEGGHDQLCKSIKKAGGAEQYNANKKYTEAVSVAVEACADDTKGQTCFIYEDSGATLDDLREAVETSEEIERTARRVFGGTHPTAKEMENVLKRARAALRAREAGKRLVFVEPT